jgi:ADP-heptose:LPS heptosyltransferase
VVIPGDRPATRTLAVRLDSLGDVLVTGPAIRALAATSDHLTVLAGPRGAAAAELLPGVDDVLTWCAPWIDPEPGPASHDHVERLRSTVAGGGFDRAVVFTSFHQSALPTALVLRTAGVPWVGAISEDYPGSLLDLRHRPAGGDVPEPERALSLALAAGGRLPAGDDGRLEVRADVLGAPPPVPGPYLVLHPGTSVPARAWPPERFRELCDLLVRAGHRVAVTGSADERALTAYVAGHDGLDLGGWTDLAGLAATLAGADVVVVGNTGPAHLAAAVGTPVVSLFAPTVPAARWAPYGVPVQLLGDQAAPCRATRATSCPVPGHPCLSTVGAHDVAAAVAQLLDLCTDVPIGR